jgi:hypothetical protein
MSSFPLGQKHFHSFLYCALLIALNLALYWTVLGGWWTIDDPALLRALIEHGIWRQFYDPAVWRAHYPVPAPGVLTPWVYLSLGLDYRLFGLHPMGFYAHHLVAQLVLVVVLCKVLEAYLKPRGAFWATVVFSCSIPAASTVSLLQMRHYLEGMILALLSLLCFRRAIQQGAMLYAMLGAFCYALATTAKESYVLLPAALLLLPGVHPWRVHRFLYPFFLVGVVYLPWRAYMLGIGSMFKPYDDLLWFEWGYIGKALNAMPGHFGLDGSWQLFLGLFTLAPFLVFLVDKGHWLLTLRMMAWAVLIFFPLLQILDFTAPWYYYSFTILISICIIHGIAYGFKQDGNGHTLAVLACVCLFIAVTYSYTKWRMNYDRDFKTRYQVEGQFILANGSQDEMLVMPMERWWHYYESLAWLRSHVLNKEPGPIVCWNPSYCSKELQTHRAFMYSIKKKQLIKWSDPNKKPSLQKLDVMVNYQLGPYGEGILKWKFGPYTKGRYLMILGDAQSRVIGFGLPMPPAGHFHINLHEPLHFVIHYETDEKRITSEPLIIDPDQARDPQGITIGWRYLPARQP